MAAYYNNLAEVYSKSNKIDDAVANYNKAAQLDPAHARLPTVQRGCGLTNAGKADDAIAAFDKVIAADPTKADAYYWKGINLIGKETIGKTARAVAPDGTAEAFQKYLELDPTAPSPSPPRTCWPASARRSKPASERRRNRRKRLKANSSQLPSSSSSKTPGARALLELANWQLALPLVTEVYDLLVLRSSALRATFIA
jgi:tetratricopeptide (TPR) repeat protein